MPELELRVPRRIRGGFLAAAPQLKRIQALPRPPERGAVALVLLGRYGDLINILPVALHIHNTYATPYLIVSRQFADLFDGVSYVKPVPIDLPPNALVDAMAFARENFDHVIQAQVWGTGYEQVKLTNAYNKESWRLAGMLPRFNDPSLMPLFDRMDWEEAEAQLKQHRKTNKPLILTNLTSGHSSPFAQGYKILPELEKRFPGYEVLDVGNIKLRHIYDLLAFVYDAKVVVSIDSALIHIATGRGVPIVALTNPHQWSGTIPRVPATIIQYSWADPLTVADAVERQLDELALHPVSSHGVKIEPPQRRILHAFSQFNETNPEARKRKAHAWRSWDRMYELGVEPTPFLENGRGLTHYMNKVRLPFLKDILANAMAQCDLDDIIIYTNDDIICHPDLVQQVRFYCSIWGAVMARRCELSPDREVPSLDDSPKEWVASARRANILHLGRDLYAFTKRTLLEIWGELPDMVIGATDWDNCLAAILRRRVGHRTTAKSYIDLIFPAEMPLGWIAHIHHPSPWDSFGNRFHSPANCHNRLLYRRWAEEHATELKFDHNNVLISP